MVTVIAREDFAYTNISNITLTLKFNLFYTGTFTLVHNVLSSTPLNCIPC